MSLRLAALLLRSRDSPYKGMGNEVKRGEKASVPNRFDNQHEWQRDKSEESSARPLMENVIPLSLSPSLSPFHIVSPLSISSPRVCLSRPSTRHFTARVTERKRCVQTYIGARIIPRRKMIPQKYRSQRIHKRLSKNLSILESIPIYIYIYRICIMLEEEIRATSKRMND